MASIDVINANLCLQHLSKLLADLEASSSPPPCLLSAISDIDALRTSVSSLRTALGAQADVAENDYYNLQGLGEEKLTLPLLVTKGAASAKARTRGEAESDMLQMTLFHQFVKAVEDKGFFGGAKEGTQEYEDRYRKIVKKFRSKLVAEAAAKEGEKMETPKSEESTATSSSMDETKKKTESYDAATIKKADAAKVDGNGHMSNKNYKKAVESYTTALKLCPKGPSSHIFYSNRAAASTYLNSYASAESDCLRAIDLKPDYSKAHARLGLARYYLEDYEGCIEAYEESLKLDPNNSNSKDFLKKANAKLKAESAEDATSSSLPTFSPDSVSNNNSSNSGAAGNPLASMMNNPAMMRMAQQAMGASGGAGDGANPLGANPIASMMNNPAMMNIAQQAMQNPEMMAFAQNMMNDPNMMANMMGSLGGAGGGGGM